MAGLSKFKRIHTGLGKLVDGVFSKSQVSRLGAGAFGDVQVGDQVGKRIRLVDSDDTDIGVSRDLSGNTVDVSLVVGSTAVGNGVLSVRGESSTITLSGRMKL